MRAEGVSTIEPSMAQSIARCFGQVAKQYDDHAQLQQQVGQRLLDQITLTPCLAEQTWLDLGTGTGAIARSIPAKQVIALDLALPMLQQAACLDTHNLVCADIMQLPLAERSVEGISANLSLQWCAPLECCLAELQRVLKPQGQLIATVPLAGCFTELLPLIRSGHLTGNTFHALSELHDGFACGVWSSVVIEPIAITLYFDSAKALLAHFKQTGAHFSPTRQAGLKGRKWWQDIQRQLRAHHTERGVPLTWNIALIRARR